MIIAKPQSTSTYCDGHNNTDANLRCHLERVRGDDNISVKSLGGKRQKFFERRRHGQWQLVCLDPGLVEL